MDAVVIQELVQLHFNRVKHVGAKSAYQRKVRRSKSGELLFSRLGAEEKGAAGSLPGATALSRSWRLASWHASLMPTPDPFRRRIVHHRYLPTPAGRATQPIG
jgi:hypothetical protein